MSRTHVALVVGAALALTVVSPARAQSTATAQAPGASESPAKDASRHFQRGVDLYNEGDVRGALVEFKRAYALLPRATVLYNIGQAEYQLQEYAPALRTLERFLADTGPNAAHRAEVQQTVEILRGRVGQIALTSDREGCEVTLDEQSVGSTPLAEPIPVSVGRRRLAVSCPGGERVTREAEVAGGQTVAIDVRLGSSPSTSAGLAASGARAAGSPVGRSGVTTGWIISAGLAATTVAAYTGALIESRRLVILRGRYPVTARQLSDKATLVSRLALAGDILAVTTLAAVGVTAYLRASGQPETGATLDVAVMGMGVGVRGNF